MSFMKDYNPVVAKVEEFSNVTKRQMFGYSCYSINKKFFVGFSNKNNYQIIVRLPKEKQQEAVKIKAVKPFSHGANKGWIEINSKLTTASGAMKWISHGFIYAQTLVK